MQPTTRRHARLNAAWQFLTDRIGIADHQTKRHIICSFLEKYNFQPKTRNEYWRRQYRADFIADRIETFANFARQMCRQLSN